MNMKIAVFSCIPAININLYVLTTKHLKKKKKQFYFLWDVKSLWVEEVS